MEGDRMTDAVPALVFVVTLIALSGFLAWLCVRYKSFFAGLFAAVAFFAALIPNIPGVSV
jgi:hypothetical protein